MSQKPWEEGSGESFGTWLQQQRKIRNLSLREVADSTKISYRYLEALESDRFEVLPAPIFAKGFLRNYATYVGLDPDEVVNFYLVADRERLEAVEDELAPSAPTRPADGRPVVALLVAIVVLVALVAAALFWRGGDSESAQEAAPGNGSESAEPTLLSTPAVGLPVPLPASTPEPPATPPVAEGPLAPLRVTLAFTGECWVEARADGRRRVSELRVQGESLQIDAEREVVLTLGDPSAVRVEVNGEPFTLPGPPGRVLRETVIDLRSLPGAGAGASADAVEVEG